MTTEITIALGSAAFGCSVISGVFGMAGGMIMMGILLSVLPPDAAMVLHGATQTLSNARRAWLWRRHVIARVVFRFSLGGGAAAGVAAAFRFVPDEAWAMIFLGLVPLLALAAPKRLHIDATKPGWGEVAGVVCVGTQFVAGVAGPLLDLFFVDTGLSRREVVATKAATQVLSHLSRVLCFGTPLLDHPTALVSPTTISVCLVGAWLGTGASRLLLERLSDEGFRRWSRRLIVGISVVHLARGFLSLATG